MIARHQTRIEGVEVRCISVIELRIKWRSQYHTVVFLQLPRIHQTFDSMYHGSPGDGSPSGQVPVSSEPCKIYDG